MRSETHNRIACAGIGAVLTAFLIFCLSLVAFGWTRWRKHETKQAVIPSVTLSTPGSDASNDVPEFDIYGNAIDPQAQNLYEADQQLIERAETKLLSDEQRFVLDMTWHIVLCDKPNRMRRMVNDNPITVCRYQTVKQLKDVVSRYQSLVSIQWQLKNDVKDVF